MAVNFKRISGKELGRSLVGHAWIRTLNRASITIVSLIDVVQSSMFFSVYFRNTLFY